MFPGRGPMLQWGIKKGEAQSLSVQAECTTPPRRGGQTVLTLLVKDKLGGNGFEDMPWCNAHREQWQLHGCD